MALWDVNLVEMSECASLFYLSISHLASVLFSLSNSLVL